MIIYKNVVTQLAYYAEGNITVETGTGYQKSLVLSFVTYLKRGFGKNINKFSEVLCLILQ